MDVRFLDKGREPPFSRILAAPDAGSLETEPLLRRGSDWGLVSRAASVSWPRLANERIAHARATPERAAKI